MPKRNQILSLLKKNKGIWVSGELLSQKIAISRAGVWKHVGKLKEAGYRIDASPKKGYRLVEGPSTMLPAEILDGLKTDFIGRSQIFYSKGLDSTNDKAKAMAAQGAPEGALVISEGQAAGRGRRGRSWFSPPHEGIYVSIILRPKMSPADAPKITLLAAAAAAEAVKMAARLPVRIKWPNDVLVGGKKIAGILSEMSTEMDVVDDVVVGLGMNVNVACFPKEIEGKATSFLLETGKRFSRTEILRGYLRVFESLYLTLKNDGFAPVLQRWSALCDIVGRRVAVETIEGVRTGTVDRIDGEGVLLLRDDQGNIRRVLSGDVAYLERP